ncbi:hypothetical protein N0B31_11230 [Salinirubellus salinus]|uniref:Uncharacterized protein n=1 Tax=Salinirubellus salinus TaxID=1364945 RepID=A0A9E7QZE3_9EURY|nr:hypothetical protein [Salinirubellus salinus]UWM52723.1 hypothetical protein N0B31_11230 [Salinirubellus salinus]
MFQDPETFAGAGIGIATGTQPIGAAPALDPGIHLRWASAPHRGVPRYGTYLFRRRSSEGRTKPVGIDTETGQQYVAGTESDFGSLAGAGSTTTGTGPFGWIEVTFTDRSYITAVDVLFTGGQSGETTLTTFTDERAVDTATVGPGPVGRQTVKLTGQYVTSFRVEGDFGLLLDVRLHSTAESLSTGWDFLSGADPLSLPLAHDDYPCVSAPATLDEARSLARDRIAYGSPDRYAAASTATPATGTAAVANGSPLVAGAGTNWSANRAGEVFHVDGDDDAYTVLSVLASDRLLLSRPYAGATDASAAYSLAPDRFGTIHDALATLVAGGPTAGGPSARATPTAVETTGTVTRTASETGVTGIGTAWDDSLEGLGLQVALHTGDMGDFTPGETTVRDVLGGYSDRLEGGILVIDGQQTRYEIAEVVSPTELTLDRPYDGPSSTSQTYTVYERAVARIDRVVSPTELELDQPHAGPTHTSGRAYRIVGSMAALGASGDETLTLAAQYPLETLSVASIDPAVAQLLGSAWVDDTVEANVAYDYLLVTDHTGYVDLLANVWNVDAGDPVDFREFVGDVVVAAEYDLVDAYLLSNLEQGDTDPPAPAAPTDVRAYDLPPSTATGTDHDRYAAGLGWDTGHVDGHLPIDAPAAYYCWRTALGDSPGSLAPATSAYTPLSDDPVTDFLADAEPVLVANGDDGPSVPGWPTAPVHAVDGRRPPGWYSYRVTGVDLFGRHTDYSEPTTWHDPETDQPATHATHPDAPGFAVELRARLPPPRPAGVTATVLDPQDPDDADDAAAVAWWDQHGRQVALRIGWAWPAAFDAQAPDTDAFECLVELGSLNSHPGTVTAVNEGPETTRVTTTLSHTVDPTDASSPSLSPGAFAGASLSVAGATFTVVDSGGGSGLWVEVRTREGPDGPVVPQTGAECALAVPAVYDTGTATVVDGDAVVTGRDTGWRDALVGQPFRLATTGETYEVTRVDSPTRLHLDRPYETPPNRPDREAAAYAVDHPVSTDYSEHDAWTFQVDDVPIDADVTDRRTPAGDRFYETTVPAPGADGGGFDPGVGSGESPVVYANVGVNARIDTDDGSLRGDVGGPAPVARAHRDPPATPEVPPLDSSVDWATHPDYDGLAHYTVRWVRPPDGVEAHVYRTLDRTLFRVDWDRRSATDAFVLDATATEYFPPSRRGDDAAERARREAITTTLTTDLDVDTWAAAETVYLGLEPDELQTLAALPGNESAFTQLTTDPLAPADAPNVRGPDYEAGDPGPGTQPGVDGVPDEMPPGDDLCAYVDSFDGRSRNHYLYRVGAVDDAHNRAGALTYPTPPTRALDAVPPETPVVTGLVAGHPDDAEADDRRLTLRWNAVRSPDLARYRVYRTTDPDAVRDVRLMDEAATLSVPVATDGDPLVTGRSDGSTVFWTDGDRDAGVDHHYRVVAEDETGNASRASDAVAGRTFDTTPPTPPTVTAEWVRVGPNGTVQPYADPFPPDERWRPAVRVTWADGASSRVLLESGPATGPDGFAPASGWLVDTTEYLHDPGESAPYRIRVRVLDDRGRQATGDPVTVPAPGGA